VGKYSILCCDMWEPEEEMKNKKRRIDKEVGTRAMIMNPSEMRYTRSRALGIKDCVEDLGAHTSEPE
jgi:hypothetical protein